MSTPAPKKISMDKCCYYYKIETSFVCELSERGMIMLTRSGKNIFIDFEQLANLERYMHLYYDLEINMEGMEAISHLLDRLEGLQREVKRLEAELINIPVKTTKYSSNGNSKNSCIY